MDHVAWNERYAVDELIWTAEPNRFLGEASNTCGAGTGERVAPASSSWTTVTLAPGRYELVCNIPGHYAAGMYTQLTVR
jgi:uncharacterized cupredoxin-like copper-binding protein